MVWDRMACDKAINSLGFKQFREFNMALLRKQGWNLITKLDALITPALEAKYFPVTSYLEASLGSNPSYLWRGFWEVNNLVK